jgi:hypothetical protein
MMQPQTPKQKPQPLKILLEKVHASETSCALNRVPKNAALSIPLLPPRLSQSPPDQKDAELTL